MSLEGEGLLGGDPVSERSTRRKAKTNMEKKLYRITLVLTEISYTGDSPEEGDMLDGDVLEEEDAPGKAGKDFTDETEARLAFKDAQIGIF